MAEAVYTTQNQNTQLIKTFIIAFGAVLLAVPIVAVITASVVQAQLGGIVSAAQAPQSNSLVGPSCEVPAGEQQASSAEGKGGVKGFFARAWKAVPFVSQSNYNSTSTTTTTTTVDNRNNGNTTVDNRWSGNTSSFTDNRWSGNTLGLNLNSGNTTNTSTTTTNTNVNVSDNGNTNNQTWNQNNNSVNNSGNTASSNTTNNNVNTNVNSGNTIVNDNDGIDVL